MADTESYAFENSSIPCILFYSLGGTGLTVSAKKQTNYSENNLLMKCKTWEDDFDNEKDLKNHMFTHSYSKP